jgi:hypothetical protein
MLLVLVLLLAVATSQKTCGVYLGSFPSTNFPSSVNGTNIVASTQQLSTTVVPSCQQNSQYVMYWTFTSNLGGWFSFETRAEFDASLAVFADSKCSQELTCNSDYYITDAKVNVYVPSNTTVFVQLSAFGTLLGQFVLTATTSTPDMPVTCGTSLYTISPAVPCVGGFPRNFPNGLYAITRCLFR